MKEGESERESEIRVTDIVRKERVREGKRGECESEIIGGLNGAIEDLT